MVLSVSTLLFIYKNRRIKVITEQERKIIEQEVREQILAERKAYKMEWRAKNKDKVKESNRKYYEKVKAKREGNNQ
jgi:hypothetical protein